MGTIVARKRKSGAMSYTAQILLRKDGEIIHREAKTFDRKAAASAWISKRETEIRASGPPVNVPSVTVRQAILKYMEDRTEPLGRTNKQVLEALAGSEFGEQACTEANSQAIVKLATDLSKTRAPATVGNYLSHLSSVFSIAEPAWGYPLNYEEMRKARIVLERMKIIGRSRERDRRPTIDELSRVMKFFSAKRADTLPMCEVVLFAMYSTRRQSEITRITWADLDEQYSRIRVRDMKDPTGSAGNHAWCDLPPEALAVALSMPRTAEQIFPYNHETIGWHWQSACRLLEIKDLHFHDLRHEGISRLFEMGWTIPHVAAVSGHRSWQNLKRYTHIRARGDKYEAWEWRPELSQNKNVAGSA